MFQSCSSHHQADDFLGSPNSLNPPHQLYPIPLDHRQKRVPSARSGNDAGYRLPQKWYNMIMAYWFIVNSKLIIIYNDSDNSDQ